MTVVISSSRSPLETMSSVERPSTPPAVASGLEESGTTSSMAGVSNGTLKLPVHSPVKRPCFPTPTHREEISAYPQANNTDVDQDFCKHYFKQATSTLVPTGATALVEKIQHASREKAIYAPCSQLLTLYSKTFYGMFASVSALYSMSLSKSYSCAS